MPLHLFVKEKDETTKYMNKPKSFLNMTYEETLSWSVMMFTNEKPSRETPMAREPPTVFER
jgi:hypothetical protein